MGPSRLDRHEYFLLIARLVSLRSTCQRRSVGCVLVDENNHIMATGYNGNVPGEIHCIEKPCKGVDDPVGDTSRCNSIHAEINALLQCPDRRTVRVVYCTDSPCYRCARLLCMLPNLSDVRYVRRYTYEGLKEIELRKGIIPIRYDNLYDGWAELIERYERGERSNG